jgi:hypothetical protein
MSKLIFIKSLMMFVFGLIYAILFSYFISLAVFFIVFFISSVNFLMSLKKISGDKYKFSLKLYFVSSIIGNIIGLLIIFNYFS